MIEFEKIKPIYAVVAFPSHKITCTYSSINTALDCNRTRMKYQGYKIIKFTPSEVIGNETCNNN